MSETPDELWRSFAELVLLCTEMSSRIGIRLESAASVTASRSDACITHSVGQDVSKDVTLA